MKIDFFKTIRKVVVLFQITMVVLTFFGVGLLLSKGNDMDLNISGLSLMPKDNNILNHYDGVGIKLKEHPELNTQLLIKKTTIKVEENSLFKGPLIVFLLSLGAFSFVLLEQMRRMMKTVEDGNPFVKDNVWRITILGTMFLLVPVLSRVFFGIFENWIQNKFEFEGLTLETTSISSFPWILAGFLFLSIGKILAEGIKLKEDQDLTV